MPVLLRSQKLLQDNLSFLEKDCVCYYKNLDGYDAEHLMKETEIGSFTAKEDPPERVLKPQVTFKFDDALDEPYYLEVMAFYPCQYNLTTAGDSRNLTKIVKFLPSASQTAR